MRRRKVRIWVARKAAHAIDAIMTAISAQSGMGGVCTGHGSNARLGDETAMPELPDLVHVEDVLREALVGKTISAARTGDPRDPTVLRIMVREPFPALLPGGGWRRSSGAGSSCASGSTAGSASWSTPCWPGVTS